MAPPWRGKIRRGNPLFHRIPRISQRNTAKRLRLRKYPKSRLFGNKHRKISVGLKGITAYFGKRGGPGPGSWQYVCLSQIISATRH